MPFFQPTTLFQAQCPCSLDPVSIEIRRKSLRSRRIMLTVVIGVVQSSTTASTRGEEWREDFGEYLVSLLFFHHPFPHLASSSKQVPTCPIIGHRSSSLRIICEETCLFGRHPTEEVGDFLMPRDIYWLCVRAFASGQNMRPSCEHVSTTTQHRCCCAHCYHVVSCQQEN